MRNRKGSSIKFLLDLCWHFCVDVVRKVGGCTDISIVRSLNDGFDEMMYIVHLSAFAIVILGTLGSDVST